MVLSVYRGGPVNKVQQRRTIKSVDLNPAPTFSVRRRHAKVDIMMRPGPQLQSQHRTPEPPAEMPPFVIALNIRSRTQKCPCPTLRLNRGTNWGMRVRHAQPNEFAHGCRTSDLQLFAEHRIRHARYAYHRTHLPAEPIPAATVPRY